MGTNVIDLTTVAAVSGILDQDVDVDAALIQTEITAYSQNILTRTSRAFLSGVRTYTERYNGNGSNEIQLRNYPILAVSALSVSGTVIPPSPDYLQTGYVIDTSGEQCAVAIIGGEYNPNGGSYSGWATAPWNGYGNAPPLGNRFILFREGIQNVAVTYTAGYTQPVYAETDAVPRSGSPVITVAQAATFYEDQGVTLADGTPLAAVSANPAAMEYVAPVFGAAIPGVYTFNAAQYGVSVNISYLYGAPPLDLSEAAARLVAEQYRRRQWISQVSQTQPQIGTTAYSRLEMMLDTAAIVNRYRRTFIV